MSRRDRIALMVIATLAVLGAAWILVVSPERKQATTLGTQLSSAETQLASAEGQLADARGAQSRYAEAYASVVSLGKAVPPNQEVPSLIYELSQASHQKNVEFASIASTTAGGAAPSTPIGAPAAAGAFTQMPFTFVFNGSFFDLEHLFTRVSGFVKQSTSGPLRVSGRLLTIQSVKLEPLTNSVAAGAHTTRTPQLTGTITASAYQLPASEGVAGGASPTSPAGSPATSTTGAASSPTAPAIARVTP
jgi:Tfp pilus assembly protein PilO